MAEFNPAFSKTMRIEGGYVNDPDDPGAETYMGISRRYHPDWSGWDLIDAYKASDLFPGILDEDRGLRHKVEIVYRRRYWDIIGLEDVESQEIAEQLFDMAVNLGTNRAVKFLQRGLNVLNRQAKLWSDLVVDGNSGSHTQSMLRMYESTEAPNFLLKTLILQRGAYYIERALEREASEKYIRGWLRRLDLR